MHHFQIFNDNSVRIRFLNLNVNYKGARCDVVDEMLHLKILQFIL